MREGEYFYTKLQYRVIIWEVFEQRPLYGCTSQSVGSAATVISFHSLLLTLASGFLSTGPYQSFRPFGDLRPDFGKTCTPQFPFSTPGSSVFSPSGYGNLSTMENIESMEEDKLISLSATPPYENTSPEELRWEEYQAKKTAAKQMTSNVATGSSSMSTLIKSISPSFPMLGLPSTSAPMLGLHSTSSSCSVLQFNTSLEWPQQSLQVPTLSVPSPITTITSFSSGIGEDQNISMQRPLVSETPANTFAVPSRLSFTFSNVEGCPSVMRGISSLPDCGNCCQERTISLLTSKQVFQKTVIRMQTRRHGSVNKKDGPRVSFLNDYSDPAGSRTLDASFVARENPKALLLKTPWLESSGTQNGTQKDNSIKAM